MSRIHDAIKRAERERTGRSDEAASREGLSDAPVATREELTGELDYPVDGPVEVEQFRSGFDFELLNTQCLKPRWSPDHKRMLFFDPAGNTTGIEELWTLSSRVEQLRHGADVKAVVITSALPGEGKTFIAGNLAQALVRGRRRRVLLIDGDLRYPRLHESLGAPSEHGLSDYLKGELDELAVIQRSPIANLFFMPAGNHVEEPGTLIVSERWKTLVEKARSCFDWIIVDSPPAALVSDANTLANACDGILFVVQSGSTPFDVAQKVRDEMTAKTIMGVILNRVAPNNKYKSYSYYRPKA
jgi:protein-tyrosine kinase